MDAETLDLTSGGAFAYGEIVWSWRAHARAKLSRQLQRLPGNDGGKSWFTGEITYKS